MHWTGRILLVLLFTIYWGGLTFYTGVVVRIIHLVLNDPMQGGLITQQVTVALQGLGFLTLPFMIWNAAGIVKHSRQLGFTLLVLTAVLACALIGLLVTHSQLDAVIDREAMEITDRVLFDAGHRRYNQLTTVQWVAALLYLPVTLIAWRKVDSASILGANCPARAC